MENQFVSSTVSPIGACSQRCMMNFKQNEEAVSPVIGVILMVAITVILAAVIAAFVFGMAGNIQSTKSVHATATHTADASGNSIIIVTFTGGPDVNLLSEDMTVTVNGDSATSATLGKETGSSVTLTTTNGVVAEKTNHVVVMAKFSDGAEQVILDTII